MTDACTSRPTILVVDDSRLMRVAARKILKEDFDILEAEDGEVAWDKLQAPAGITLVMSDLSMPNLDGLGLLKKIRESAHAHLKDLPVIIVTGAEDDDGSKKTAFSAGASDFITKPFDSVQLLARAKAQARQQHTQQALQSSEATKQHLEEQSQVDQLTGLANRRAFMKRIEEDLSYAVRHKSELCLMLVRIEGYKVMFLRHGKQRAEEVLRQVAGLLSHGRRREDTVARIGMDTFGMLLPSANPPGASRVAQQLREAVQQHDFRAEGESISVSASIGIGSADIDAGISAEALLAQATQALSGDQRAPAAPAAVMAPEAREVSPAEPASVPEPASEAVRIAEATTHDAPPAAAEMPLRSLEATHEPSSQTDPDVAGSVPAQTDAVTTLLASPAGVIEVAQALHALVGNPESAPHPDHLLQAVMPVIESWNLAHGGKYRAIVDQLKSALPDNAEAVPRRRAGVSSERV